MEWNWCVRFYIMLSPCSADKPNLGKARLPLLFAKLCGSHLRHAPRCVLCCVSSGNVLIMFTSFENFV